MSAYDNNNNINECWYDLTNESYNSRQKSLGHLQKYDEKP